jgi:transposase
MSAVDGGSKVPGDGEVRILSAQRRQLELRTFDLDATLPGEHRARLLWAAVERLDLSKFYAAIKARGELPGRPAIDPKILVTLWLYATSEGVGSARAVARRCSSEDAYRWICGGVGINHHTLSDFRVVHGAAVDDLLTQVLAVLMRQGLVKLQRVAHDGMRVRASAGASSFRREKSLRECLEKARVHVERLRKDLERDPSAASTRERAAQERAAQERQSRLDRALAELPKVQAAKKRQRGKKFRPVSEARVSSTDPDARVMKMADGGFRPGYNVQLSTDTDSRIIVEYDVTNSGSDMGLVEPMLDAVERRTGSLPADHLVDGGFARKQSIEEAHERGVRIYAPPMKRGRATIPRKRNESAAVASWRARMDSAEGQAIYALRAAVAETVNADLRCHRSLDRIPVRGEAKVRAVVSWNVLAYNLMRAIVLERTAA